MSTPPVYNRQPYRYPIYYPANPCHQNNKQPVEYNAVSIKNINPTVNVPSEPLPYNQIPPNAWTGTCPYCIPCPQHVQQLPPAVQPPIVDFNPPKNVELPAPVITSNAPLPPAPAPAPAPTPAPVEPKTEVQSQVIQQPTVIYEAPKAPETEQPKETTETKEIKEETKPEVKAEPVKPEPPAAVETAPEINPALSGAIAALRSDDIEKQAKTMENICSILENMPENGEQKTEEALPRQVLVDSLVDVMKKDAPKTEGKLPGQLLIDSVADILKKDTSKMEGPTPHQIVLRQKLIDGQKLSDAEDKEAKQLSQMESAEKNKQYALYTLAMIQNNITNELEKKGEKVEFNDLPEINSVVETATKNPNPMLRASAIAGLSYMAKPEYSDILSAVFEAAKKDEDESVKEVSQFALNKLPKKTVPRPTEVART